MKFIKLGSVADVRISGVDKKTIVGESPVRLCNYTDVYYNWTIRHNMSNPFMVASARREEIEKNFPKYHNKIDESKLTIISDIEADYKRRQGNLVLGLAKAIKLYVRDKPKTLKLKPNDKQYKRRRAIATYNIRSLFNKFLRSFADDSELLERDFSHRLQDIEK